MNFGTATILVAILLAPGVAMLLVGLSTMRVRRDLGNAALTVILSAGLALVAHILAAAIGGAAWWALGNPQWIEHVVRTLDRLVRGTSQIGAGGALNLILYAAYASGIGALLGWAGGRVVIGHVLPLRAFHGPYYPYTRPSLIVYASVLTTTEIGEGRLLYDGLLAEVTIGRGAGFDGVALIAPVRMLMMPGGTRKRAVRISGPDDIGATTSDPQTRIFLNAGEIANIVIYTQPLPVGAYPAAASA